MPRQPTSRHRIALAERTVMEALRVFAPRTRRDGRRHAPPPAVPPLHAVPPGVLHGDELLAMVDDRTLTGTPSANALLVYRPTPLLLDSLRAEVAPEDWQHFAAPGAHDEARDRLLVGALRGGELVALATASRPLGRLSQLRVLVSPAFRQIGLGHLVLHRAVQAVLRENLLPFATLVSTDLTARALARAVGFVNVTRALGPLGSFAPLAPAF